MTAAADAAALEQRLALLEGRLRDLEDRQAIYQLIASYGLAADGMSRAGLAGLWAEDGTYDTEHHVFNGAAEVGAIVEDPMHLAFVEQGSAHVLSLPHVALHGDTAVATNYSRVYVHRGTEWQVARAAANRWELARDAAGRWQVVRRVNRLLQGSEIPRALLARAVGAAE